MSEHRATYSPDDNKLRLYPAWRLDEDEYEKVKTAGFRWAPKQKLFVCPSWSPAAEDLMILMAGEVEDEDTSLVERATERSDRFKDYSAARRDDAEAANNAVEAIASMIPLGQPILVGHHSEKHARRDAQKIENGMRKAIRFWDQAEYWTDRAKSAVRHAKYLERVDVRQRRIRKLESELRGKERDKADAVKILNLWLDDTIELDQERALKIANGIDRFGIRLPDGEHTWDLWGALNAGKVAPNYVREYRREHLPHYMSRCDRWIEHYQMRITYERAMIADAGGTIVERKGPEVGGACKCWCSPRGGMSIIVKVNKVSVTVMDNWGNGGENFTRTIPFDKLSQILSKAEVDKARADGRLREVQGQHRVYIHPKQEPEQPEAAHAS